MTTKKARFPARTPAGWLLILLAAFAVEQAAAKSYSVEAIKVEARVTEEGALLVREAITYDFDCSEVEGTGINCSGESITLDATGDWTGTLDGYNAVDLLRMWATWIPTGLHSSES